MPRLSTRLLAIPYAPELAAAAWIVGYVALSEWLYLNTTYVLPIFSRFFLLPIGTFLVLAVCPRPRAQKIGAAEPRRLVPVLLVLVTLIAAVSIGHAVRVAVLEHRFNRDLAPLSGALLAYAAKHGKMPERMQELVPEFIAAIPFPPHPAGDFSDSPTAPVFATFVAFDAMRFDRDTRRWVFVPD